jgi:hypothetical protein
MKGANSGGSHLVLKDEAVLEANLSKGMKRKSFVASAFLTQRNEL